jgi:hypothetical protein
MTGSHRTSTRSGSKAPWERPAPASKRPTKSLSPAEKQRARARAKRAGRSYPNLVDNMRVASTKKKTVRKRSASTKRKSARAPARKTPAGKTAARKTAARKTATRKSATAHKVRRRAPVRSRARRRPVTPRTQPRSSPLRDPQGGLTAAGRAAFHRRDGSRLKPGVKKPISEMTAVEMRRKGSWAVRFYGRSGPLPPLQDKQGKPTRFALTAAAWGEPVPKNAQAARSIATRGRRLLERAKKSKAR